MSLPPQYFLDISSGAEGPKRIVTRSLSRHNYTSYDTSYHTSYCSQGPDYRTLSENETGLSGSRSYVNQCLVYTSKTKQGREKVSPLKPLERF